MLARLLTSLIVLIVLSVAAEAQTVICAPILGFSSMSRQLVNPNNSHTYILDSRGCVVVTDNADVQYFASQGIVPPLGSGPGGQPAVGVAVSAVGTANSLRTISVEGVASGSAIEALGGAAPLDGGGGIYDYISDSTEVDDGGIVIAPASGIGRWIRRVTELELPFQVWGAVSDSTGVAVGGNTALTNTPAMQAAIDYTMSHNINIACKGIFYTDTLFLRTNSTFNLHGRNYENNNDSCGIRFTVQHAVTAAATSGGTLPAGVYFVRVYALDGGGSIIKLPTNTICFGSTNCMLDQVMASTGAGISLNGTSTNAINLSWNAVAGAVTYRVYFGTAFKVESQVGSTSNMPPADYTTYFDTASTTYSLTTTAGAATATAPDWVHPVLWVSPANNPRMNLQDVGIAGQHRASHTIYFADRLNPNGTTNFTFSYTGNWRNAYIASGVLNSVYFGSGRAAIHTYGSHFYNGRDVFQMNGSSDWVLSGDEFGNGSRNNVLLNTSGPGAINGASIFVGKNGLTISALSNRIAVNNSFIDTQSGYLARVSGDQDSFVNTRFVSGCLGAHIGTISSPTSGPVQLTFNQTNGSGYGAGTNVNSISIDNPGSGGVDGVYTATLNGGDGSGAVGQYTVSGGKVTAVSIFNSGSGYAIGNTLTATASSIGGVTSFSSTVDTIGYKAIALTGGTGTGATADFTTSGGAVATFLIRSPGTGYLPGDILAVNNADLGGGTGFSIQVRSVTCGDIQVNGVPAAIIAPLFLPGNGRTIFPAYNIWFEDDNACPSSVIGAVRSASGDGQEVDFTNEPRCITANGWFPVNVHPATKPVAPDGATVSHMSNTAGSNTRLEIDGYANGTSARPLISLRSFQGTQPTPTAITSTSILGTIQFRGATDSTGSTAPTAVIECNPTQDWDNNHTGSRCTLYGTGDSVGPSTTRALQWQTGVQICVSGTSLKLSAGELGLTKRSTDSAEAPGADGLKLEVICGTNSGSAAIVVRAGTSTTSSYLLNNIGSGVNGC